jgi:hypothetical protein
VRRPRRLTPRRPTAADLLSPADQRAEPASKTALRQAVWRWGPHRQSHTRHRGEPEGHPMTNQIDALNAMAVLVANRNYQGAVDIAVCLDHERLAEITVALVRMCAVGQIEFFHCQDLSEDQARDQAAAFFRAGLGFPQKDGG